mmetsp:Transcript_9837/g.20869  ORF Transcript_9837/g.20869 Transcript_9837/m.20869 type:complete len:308 (-) Transcript_9837:58-981(-)
MATTVRPGPPETLHASPMDCARVLSRSRSNAPRKTRRNSTFTTTSNRVLSGDSGTTSRSHTVATKPAKTLGARTNVETKYRLTATGMPRKSSGSRKSCTSMVSLASAATVSWVSDGLRATFELLESRSRLKPFMISMTVRCHPPCKGDARSANASLVKEFTSSAITSTFWSPSTTGWPAASATSAAACISLSSSARKGEPAACICKTFSQRLGQLSITTAPSSPCSESCWVTRAALDTEQGLKCMHPTSTTSEPVPGSVKERTCRSCGKAPRRACGDSHRSLRRRWLRPSDCPGLAKDTAAVTTAAA